MHSTNTAPFLVSDDTLMIDLHSLIDKIYRTHQISKLAVLTDDNTKHYCFPVIQDQIPGNASVFHLTLPPGEDQKDWRTAEMIIQKFISEGLDRNTLILNLGGGVVSDLGGFIASVYKRGIPFINIPTTLLAQVDASYGGKTGVNIQGAKNQAGTFQHPEIVYVNPIFLRTLPEREWRSGLGELFKYSLLGARLHLETIPEIFTRDLPFQAEMIKECLQFKQDIIQTDFWENGIRSILNFGHTVGHALEAYAHQTGITLTHGEAVAAGLVAETYVSYLKNQLPDDILQNVSRFYSTHFQQKEGIFNQGEVLWRWMLHDKKSTRGAVRMVLLNKQGEPTLPEEVTKDLIIASLSYLNGINP